MDAGSEELHSSQHGTKTMHEVTATLRGARDARHEPGLRHRTIRCVIDRLAQVRSLLTRQAIPRKLMKRRCGLPHQNILQRAQGVPVINESLQRRSSDRWPVRVQRIHIRAGAPGRMSLTATGERMNRYNTHWKGDPHETAQRCQAYGRRSRGIQ